MTDHLARLCFEGHRHSSGGSYTPHTSRLRLDGRVRPADHMVYLHETHHAALNDVTAWGTALHLYARLPEMPHRNFDALLDASRITHESLATFASVEIAAARHGVGEMKAILTAYPDYIPLYEAIRLLLGNVEGANRRQLAASALARSCMQTPVLREILLAGFEDFRLAAVRERDRPDGRWRWFLRQGPSLLGAAGKAADIAVTARFGTAVLEDDRPESSLYTSTARTHDEAWDHWEASMYERLCSALAATGATTFPLHSHQADTAALLTAAEARHGDLGLRTAMTEEQRGRDAAVASAVLQQVRHEFSDGVPHRAMLLPTMEPARLVEILTARPVTADRPALMIDARPLNRLKVLYRWLEAEGDPPECPRSPNVPLVAARMIVDDGTPELVVGHARIPDLEALTALAEAWHGRGPLIACISAGCLADADWARLWVPAILELGSLFVLADVEPERFVPAWARADRSVNVVSMDISDTAGERTALFFSPDQGTIWWFVVADDVTVRLMSEYLRGELGPRLHSAVDGFAPVRDAARVVIGHLLATESFVGFDALGGP